MPSPDPSIVIIDCGAGNLHSVRKAFASQLPANATLTIATDAAALKTATHIVLPGVGAFADCMSGLNGLPGMRFALEEKVLYQETPFLGICVGMQMLFERGYEHGTHEGLGWFKGEVAPIAPADPSLRIPHMGWNRLHIKPNKSRVASHGEPRSEQGVSEAKRKRSPSTMIFDGIEDDAFVYFVHSYAAQNTHPEEVLATASYGGDIVSVIGRDNIIATQFHPEKSQAIGLRLIHNFLSK